MKTTYRLTTSSFTLTGTAQEILASAEILEISEHVAYALGQIATGHRDTYVHYACHCIAEDYSIIIIDDHRIADLLEAFQTLSSPLVPALVDMTNRLISVTAHNNESANAKFALAHLSTFINTL